MLVAYRCMSAAARLGIVHTWLAHAADESIRRCEAWRCDPLLNYVGHYYYFAPGRGAKYCDEYVCLSVRITRKLQAKLQLFVHICRDSVLL